MAETDWHRDLMLLLIEVLRAFYAGRRVYVSGNLLLFYEPGNRRRHVSPDVWLARGVENRPRPNYLIWEEPRGPEFVIELTSSSTRDEDLRTKFTLYRDTLKVREYFLFDPRGDYLEPRLGGYRLRGGVYQTIRPRQGRLPSQVTGLHLEADGDMLRLWNPQTQAWLPTPQEARDQSETARQQAEAARQQAEAAREQAEAARQQAEVGRQQAEVAREQAEERAKEATNEARALREQIEKRQRRRRGDS
jgi:Uma2 family endonuclease